MKKATTMLALLCAVAFAQQKGTVSGVVIDPFSGKAVEQPTVWIKGTTFTSQKMPEGKFKFEGIPVSNSAYTLQAGKSKYSQSQVKFSITKDNLNVVQNLYIYRQDVAPGLYRPIEGKEAEKISARAVYQAVCKESGFAFRVKFTTENPSTKKKEENVLPPPANVPTDVAFLSKIATSVTSPIEVTSYPVLSESAKKHEDCGIDAKETLLVPNLSKGTSIPSDYKGENLHEIKGTLPKGEQFLTIKQDGKLVNAYYVNVQQSSQNGFNVTAKSVSGFTVIDDFEDGNGSANTLEYWYAYTDAADKGTSMIGNAKQGSGYAVVMRDGSDWVAKIQNYTLSKGGNPYEPYVALGLEAKNNGKTYDLSKCSNGFSYRYKGSTHNFRAESSIVSDYAFHQKRLAASANWATATVPLSQLVQPNWGAQKPFNAKNIKAFSWEIKGDVSAKTGSLAIDDFRCLGDMPLK